MKSIYIKLVLITLMITGIQADELSDAYQKEYTFLKAQKHELKNRLYQEKSQHKQDQYIANSKVDAIQEKIVSLANDVQTEQENLSRLKQSLSEIQDNSQITDSVLMQARSSLQMYKIKVDESNSTTNAQKLQLAFKDASKLYTELSSIRTQKGKFFLKDGSTVQGDLVKVGNVATYGLSAKAAGALAPAGEGAFKIWNVTGSADDAQALFAHKPLKTIDIFLYENVDKEVEYTQEKTIEDTIKAGGLIGYIILGLGVVGLLLIILRVIFLIKSGSNVTKISNIVVDKFNDCNASNALNAIKDFKGSTARVIKTTIRNIKKDRAHVEDVVMESILNESTSLDRFGNFILVIAAVAPLLGLLGTVSGMISTFDIITQYGTGDPKLLAGGISEALVTTMLGLIVAIPLLLIGNLLSGWAQNIKDSMEQSALHIVNLYEKNREKCKQ